MPYTKVGLGRGHHIDSIEAGKEAAHKALERMEAQKADFAFVFAGVGYDQNQVLSGISSVLGNVPIAGCSAKGIILDDVCDENINTVGVMTIASDQIEFTTALAKNVSLDSKKAGEQVAKAIKGGFDSPLALFVFADGLKINMRSFFAGLGEKTPQFLPVFGGLAADNWQFKHTYQYFDNQAYEDSASCVLISGSLNMIYEVTHGCVPLGLDRILTKVQGNKILEIDNKPAYKVFEEYFGEEEAKDFAKAVGYICLGEKLPADLQTVYDPYIIRATLSYDPQENSITIPTEIPEGSKIRLTRRDFNKIMSKNQEVSQRLKEKLKGKKPKFVIYSDCAGRGEMFFGKECSAEVRCLREQVGKEVPFFGFYSYGEFAPLGQKNYFHNYTGVPVVFY